MSQSLAHRLQPPDPRIQFIRLGQQQLPVDLLVHQHRSHFIQRKSRSLPQGDQCQPVRHIGCKLPPLAAPGE
ncbi:hypothetical protein D3C76_1798030 [compost metagenome]